MPSTHPVADVAAAAPKVRRLSARLEPFDSYWQAPKDVEAGYSKFGAYYRANFLPHLPSDREASILVVSCGPGYLVKLLTDLGYRRVLGIDSDPAKVALAARRGLDCRAAEAFPFLAGRTEEFDAIVGEQELNHLTKEEMIEFLEMCRSALKPGGVLVVYGLNGANPITGPDSLAHNIDHFHTFTEYSLGQALEIAGFEDIRAFPLQLYVFWKNPLNYLGLAVTSLLHLFFRAVFIMYAKDAKIFTKKLGAVARKRAT
ncbi:MAG: class I SAM-dependent methyltransferase [bacterium]